MIEATFYFALAACYVGLACHYCGWLPDLDDVRLVKEPAPVRAPAPKNRIQFKLKLPFFAEGEAEGLFGITAFMMVLMVFAVARVVSGEPGRAGRAGRRICETGVGGGHDDES
jgi:hypothetical protein